MSVRNLTPPEFSSILWEEYRISLTPNTLAKIRCLRSDGPPFVRVGRNIRYPEEPGREWALSQISPPRRSTSEK